MMTSETTARQAYIWIWLPGRSQPVVAGRLAYVDGKLRFHYGKSYLERSDAIAIFHPELPLQAGVLPLAPGHAIPGCLRDALPDAWGRRVVMNRLLGIRSRNADSAVLDELTYGLESGSDRIGALDFQTSATEHVPRLAGAASLEELQEAALRLEKGLSLSAELDQALNHGTSIGGARPKALIDGDERKYVVKFSSSSDVYPVAKAEYIAMRLGALAGLDTAPVQLTHIAGRDALLIERFDRIRSEAGWQRRALVSALTLHGLDEMMARYASYETLAEIIRHRFTEPTATLRELFARLTFNILCGNTDDHARNHAAFWDGTRLSLTPAYDICPQSRTGNEASQAMLIHGQNRLSRLSICVDAASHFLLSGHKAQAIIDAQVESIHTHWNSVCDEAELSATHRTLLWQRQFLNTFAFS